VAQVTIVGLNALGASLGLALRKADPTLTVVGVERDAQVARRAQQAGAVERIERWVENACKNAALVILTEPLSRLRDILQAIAANLPQGSVVTSTAPLIAPVLAWAEELLPDGVSFVAGHPILDPTKPGDVSSSELFRQAQYCIVPSAQASAAAMDLVTQLATTIGARPFFLDAVEHDGLVTAVDGLPGLLGAALMSAAAGASSWHDMRRVAGPVFARATASADAEPAETAAALRANRDNVARWLESYRAKLSDLRAALLADDAEQLTKLLADAREARDQWLGDQRSGNWDNVIEAPQVSKSEMYVRMVWPQLHRPEDDKKRKK
jgi:prephenate dehydrogenase